ncbi:MAG TPA: heparan-alpha-glucosaminide N-acetyltransferase domain-containing protein [Chryseolinea sp.]|nr:heparan-alpha-glucosaminide N-acetyltransferase domain-containing protein [Chryseolinea sp.]
MEFKEYNPQRLVTSLTKNRIDSIDILRGIVMVIMALDHVRDYFHIAANTSDPLGLATTTTFLFFTRWITHFCAPIFIFLSGISIYLQSLRKTKKELSSFLITRGLWLILAEVIIVSFGWSFNPIYRFMFLQVIWAIGISMVILGLLIYLPFNAIFVLGLVIVLGHNLLDIPESAPGFKAGFWWDLFHHGSFVQYPYAQNHSLFLVYPFLPWLGLMMIGYCTGIFFAPEFQPERRRQVLTRIGVGLILFFIVLRLINVYGDPVPWTSQKTNWLTFLSFLKINKYPPSLLFMCLTVGTAFLLLPVLEKFQNGFTNVMRTYGRVAFFYYVGHIYLVHVLTAICFFGRGHSFEDVGNIGQQYPFYFVAVGEGYSLPLVYLVWIVVIVLLYPLCKWYDRYKTTHREKWWLSYV